MKVVMLKFSRVERAPSSAAVDLVFDLVFVVAFSPPRLAAQPPYSQSPNSKSWNTAPVFPS
jgi:hypothetical protein